MGKEIQPQVGTLPGNAGPGKSPGRKPEGDTIHLTSNRELQNVRGDSLELQKSRTNTLSFRNGMSG